MNNDDVIAPENPCLKAPSFERNRDFVLDVLRDVLPPRGLVLEIGSGTGQHVAWFARALGALTWQPTEPRTECHASIAAWVAEAGVQNVLPPLRLDTRERPWPVERADAVVSINMVHISPWASCLALLAGAAEVLADGAPLLLYGPYRVAGRHVAPSNAAFDQKLLEQNPEWGVRDITDVAAAADGMGLELTESIPTPHNNYTLVLRRTVTS